MIRKSSCIFVLTLVVLALVAAVGSIDNNRMIAGNNGVSDNEIVTDMDDMVKYDISIESVKQDKVSGTLSGGETGTSENVSETPTEPVTQAPTEPATEPATEPVTEAPTEPVTEPETAAPVNWKYVYVGDSRTKGLKAALEKYGRITGKETFICEIGEGYDFLMANMANIRSVCDSSTVLIIGLGINDMKYRYNEYIAAINNMAATMDCQIYFMLVNPVNEAEEAADGKFHITNADIDTFNARMLSGLGPSVHIIDTNSYLKNVIVNYTTMDGLHYTDETYIIVYDYMQILYLIVKNNEIRKTLCESRF